MELKLNMNVLVPSILIAVTISLVAYMIVVVWWVGLIKVWHEEKRLKHETCYTEYGYEPIRDQRYVKVSYCGEPITEP